MRKLFRVFCRDQAGSYTILAGLAMPMLVGLSGLGTEVGLWYYKHQSMQAAADSGAVSAATANSGNIADLEMQAYSVAASYGYINGVDGSTVSVNRPPASGAFTGVAGAVEVIVQQPQARLFTSVYQSGEVLIGARAVATPSARARLRARPRSRRQLGRELPGLGGGLPQRLRSLFEFQRCDVRLGRGIEPALGYDGSGCGTRVGPGQHDHHAGNF